MWNTQSQCYQRKRLNPGEQSTPSCLYGSKIGDQNNRAESYIYLYDKESHWCGSLLLLCLNLSWSLHTIVYSLLVFLILFLSLSFMYYIPLSKGGSLCIPTCSNCFSVLASSDNTRCIRHVSVLSLSSSLIVQFLRLFECRRRLASWFVRASVAREKTEAFPFWTGLFWCLCTSQKNKTKTHSCIVM